MPLIHQEEILCKESMLVFKVSFVTLMCCQHRAHWILLKYGICSRISPTNSRGTILCSLCKHIRSLNFPFGNGITLCTKGDINEMEAAAKRFEREDGVVKESQQLTKQDSDFILLPKSLRSPGDDGYAPYCKINMVHKNSYQSSPSCDESSITHYGNPDGYETRPTVDCCNDDSDSDSEVFRVKRRSVKVKKVNVCSTATALKNFEHQGLKQVNKLHPERRGRQMVALLDSSTATRYKHNFSSSAVLHSNAASSKTSEDQSAKANRLHISVKYKTLDEDPTSRERECYRNDSFHHGLKRNFRESLQIKGNLREQPQVQAGPKRIKVRVPSSDSSLPFTYRY